MSNKPEHTSYFREIIRRLKEVEVEFRKSREEFDGEIYSEMESKVKLMELPFPPEMFDRLSSEEKESLFIWLNKDTMPQA